MTSETTQERDLQSAWDPTTQRERWFREAEEAYRQACFGFLGACFRGAPPEQIKHYAHIMKLAREEMEARE